jgi:glycerophosphoryl diester phosphodiesterase
MMVVLRRHNAVKPGWFLTLVFCSLCAGCTPDGDFQVVHHRANGCRSDAPENALMGIQCVIERCTQGTTPCALEGDVRVLRLSDGSLGEDLEMVWIHDGTTERTAACSGGVIALPGTSPVDASRFASCRLRRLDGVVTEQEPIPTLDEVLALLQGTPVQIFLELKGADDTALDARLAREAALRVEAAGLREQTIVTSFEPGMLQVVRETLPGVETACFAPSGQATDQVLTVLLGGILSDVDTCLRQGNDWVFVPPWALDGDVVRHVKGLERGLGVFGADTQDGFDQVQSWRHRVDVVYADHPSIYEE